MEKTPVDMGPLHFLPLPFTLVWDPEGEMGNQITGESLIWVGPRSSKDEGDANWEINSWTFHRSIFTQPETAGRDLYVVVKFFLAQCLNFGQSAC